MTYIFEALEAPIVNGIHKEEIIKELKTLKRLLDGQSVSFDYHNIELKQDLNELKINAIVPTIFFKSFKELGFEPKVPDNAKENNIVSYYHSNFSKYNNLTVDEETFLYKAADFPAFETEALFLSTLLKQSNKYKDFRKPYLSLEFYADTRKDENYGIVNNHFDKSISDTERRGYLQRFVRDNQILVVHEAAVVKSSKAKTQAIYSSYEDPNPLDKTTQKLRRIFEKKFPPFNKSILGPNFGVPIAVSNFGNPSPQVSSFEDVKSGKFCSYDIIGYVITKRRGDDIIKRTYVLNDKKDYKGYLKYFDSQIKENEEYSYTIEQINKIYGKTFDKSPDKKYKYPDGYLVNQKGIFREDNPDIDKVFESLLDTDVGIAKSTDEKNLPFYNAKNFKVEIPFDVKNRQMVAYSPLSSLEDLESPDIKLNTKILLLKPSIPEISIFSRKGDPRNVLIMLSNILGIKKKITGLDAEQDTKVKIVNLGFDVEEIKVLTKEFYLYRTTEKPRSYDSFPEQPHKILPVDNPDFLDDIEPNVVYYYYAKSISEAGVDSEPSKVLKMEMIQEQDHVFMLLEVYDFGEEKKNITEKMFRKDLVLSPTLLQSSIKNMTLGGYIDPKNKNGYVNRLFKKSNQILRPTQLPSHKLRITSKKTRRRLDINVIYSYEEIKQFEELPASAELVIENKPKLIDSDSDVLGTEKEETWVVPPSEVIEFGKLNSPCNKSNQCGEGLYCKGTVQTENYVVKFGKCSSKTEVVEDVKKKIPPKGKCDASGTIANLLVAFGSSNAGGAWLLALTFVGLIKNASDKAESWSDCENLNSLMLEEIDDENTKEALKKGGFLDKPISGIWTGEKSNIPEDQKSPATET